jgi:hypothetical protein
MTIGGLIQRGELLHVRPTPRTVRVPESAVTALAMGIAPVIPTTEGA